MRGVAALVFAAAIGAGLAGCSTNGQPNSFEFTEADVLASALAIVGIAVTYDPHVPEVRSIPGAAPPLSTQRVSDALSYHDFALPSAPRPRSNYGNIENPFLDTRARTRSGGFRNSWRTRNGDCRPQPTCTLRAK